MDINIRQCTPSDVQTLEALAKRTFFDTFTGTCTSGDMDSFLDTYYNKSSLRLELESPGDYCYFAEIAGAPVAYIRFKEGITPFPNEGCSHPLELNRLYVDKPFLGQGIAKPLMELFIEYATENKHDLLWLGVWEHNHRAQAFYRKYGFTFTGCRHPFPIGDTPQTDEWWSREHF